MFSLKGILPKRLFAAIRRHMSRKTIAKRINALSMKEGDILLISGDNEQAKEQIAVAIKEQRNELKLPKSQIVVLPHGVMLESVSEAQMNRMGWRRS